MLQIFHFINYLYPNINLGDEKLCCKVNPRNITENTIHQILCLKMDYAAQYTSEKPGKQQ